MQNIGDWGHEYIRQLETEVVEEWSTVSDTTELLSLIKDIITFDCHYHAEIQACDMLMEIDKLELLPDHIDSSTYARICLYLTSCVKYVDSVEGLKILKLVAKQYIRFGENTKALIIAIQLNDKDMVNQIFANCTDK